MNILQLIAEAASKFERFIEVTLDPELNIAKPKEALVKVRLTDLLPPELPGWPPKYPTEHR